MGETNPSHPFLDKKIFQTEDIPREGKRLKPLATSRNQGQGCH